jgi:uncharacterized protein (DUF2252 family)
MPPAARCGSVRGTQRTAAREAEIDMTVLQTAHPTVAERAEHGRQAREHAPLAGSTGWRRAADRPDPVALLDEQNRTRDQDLVPVRHGRMLASPFTFYRGAARVMAADLAATPTAGLDVQLCGDAHLSNFGAFASPERRLLFDLNDFDETLPGPFEYDVRRMAASFTIAARNNGFSRADTVAATMASVAAYREAMAGFAQLGTMQVWYSRLDEDDITTAVKAALASAEQQDGKGKARPRKKDEHGRKGDRGEVDRELQRAAKNVEKTRRKAHARDSLQALSKLAERVDGRYRIVSQPPIVVPVRDLASSYGLSGDETEQVVRDQFRAYRETLPDDRRLLLDRFEVVDVARKVVGVGSVGTRAFIVLLQGRDEHDPLFLQVKEATTSVLEEHLPRSRHAQPGERVVQGQRIMQAASDIFLGWTVGADVHRHFYWRQLRDMKGSAVVEAMIPAGMVVYARMCGWTLARAHARSGDPVAMAAYLGDDDTFDRAVTDFSARYADQNEEDFERFATAVRAGRLRAVEGV